MGDRSGISWCDATWNPIVGCSVISPGCTNCYAMKQAARIERMNPKSHYVGTTIETKAGAVWSGKLVLAPEHILTLPLRWRRARKIFVNSMGDVFHEDSKTEWIDTVLAIAGLSPHHIFQILTKRSQDMMRYMRDPNTRERIGGAMFKFVEGSDIGEKARKIRASFKVYPFQNVWFGASAEDQDRADLRIPDLVDTPAAVRFISYEPALGPINFMPWIGQIDLIIYGGESGPGARPNVVGWAKSTLRQCRGTRTSFFMKQLGANPVNREGVRHLQKARAGDDKMEWPEELRVQMKPGETIGLTG